MVVTSEVYFVSSEVADFVLHFMKDFKLESLYNENKELFSKVPLTVEITYPNREEHSGSIIYSLNFQKEMGHSDKEHNNIYSIELNKNSAQWKRFGSKLAVRGLLHCYVEQGLVECVQNETDSMMSAII